MNIQVKALFWLDGLPDDIDPDSLYIEIPWDQVVVRVAGKIVEVSVGDEEVSLTGESEEEDDDDE